MNRVVVWPLAAVCLVGCKGKAPAEAPVSTTATPLADIAGHTSGSISRHSVITVQFTRDRVDAAAVNAALEESPLVLDPKVSGVAVWTSPQRLEFRPNTPLEPGRNYGAKLSLVGLAEPLQFYFNVIPQSYELTLYGLQAVHPDAPEHQAFRGSLRTADVAASADVEKMLSAQQGGRALGVEWSHDPEGRSHDFTVVGIERQAGNSELSLRITGEPIGVEREHSEVVQVPGLDTFDLLQARGVQGDEQYVELRFTDALKRKQNLRGLIRVEGKPNVRLVIDGSIVRIYSNQAWSAQEKVQISSSVLNVRDKGLATDKEVVVSFDALKPQVRFVQKGVIVPTSQGLTVPIEAANLRAVRVTAVRIHDSNLSQFLQVNDLDGEREIQRVGRRVWRKVIALDPTPDKANRWVRYGIDITPLTRENPNGLYRIELDFRRQHITYVCRDDAAADTSAVMSDEAGDDLHWAQENEASAWDNYEGDGEDYDYSEWYEQRNNPCHPAYYREYYDHKLKASRNVLITDIGLIAKVGGDGALVALATDLKSAQPLSGVAVEALDYQRQVLATGKTDVEGMVRLALPRAAYFLTAAHNGQASILRLDTGNALAVGHFDVGGVKLAQGLKGFFYGERGVWRPGDAIYLTFILHDTGGTFPKEHPLRLELVNPRGQVIEQLTRRTSPDGFHVFHLRTAADAPTGDYLVRVSLGGAKFEKTIKIETVTPNRLKVALDFGASRLQGAKAKVAGTLRSQWLHGAPAKHLEADVRASLEAMPTRFAKFEDYSFDDATRTYAPESHEVFRGVLDATGSAALNAVLEVGSAPPGMLRAQFHTRVFEPGGAFSVGHSSLPYSPYDRYVGIRTPKGDKARGMLLTDTKHEVQLVALDAGGRPAGDAEVLVRLYKINWRWWWEKGEESLADYVGTSGYSPLQKDSVKLVRGEGTWTFEIKYPDWGRYLIVAADAKGGHRSSRVIYVDWPGWAGRGQKDTPGGATVLTFASDKAEYEVGEPITLTIPTAMKGRVLLSLESGSRVLETRWLEAGADHVVHTFAATAAMAPGIYAHAMLVQPHLQAQNDLPMRMYGVTPIRVSDPSTKLAPVIEAPPSFEPESKAVVQVYEKTGRPMTYTLAVVDEGLLGLTGFATPDPWGHFYQREALGVTTWDLYDLVAGAYGGQLEKLLAIGGDEEGAAAQAQKRANRFPPMVSFLGPFAVESKGRNKHEIAIPQYVGAVRVMVVAGHGGAFGAAEQSVTVKKPLMVLATLPRVLGPQEEVGLPVSVFALDEKVRAVTVTARAEGLLSVVGEAKARVEFSSPGDELVTFRLRVGEQLGVGKVIVEASGGGERAEQSIEIEVRHPARPVVDVLATALEPGQTWDVDAVLPGMPGTNTVTLEVSKVPPLNLEQRLNELITYPHGCVEQTTSTAFPQLYLSGLLELTPAEAAEVERNVKGGIDRLRGFQLADGGFGYWPGDGRAQDWSSSYVGHFLIEAKRLGYLLPPGMLEQWQKYQRQAASTWSATAQERSDLVQAYRLFTLALAGHPDLSSMNRLKEQRGLSAAAGWRLAAAYQLAGQPETAKALVSAAPWDFESKRELFGTFGAPERDRAMVLEALVLMGDLARANEVAQSVSSDLSSDRWLSTQSAAYALVAMARFASVTSSSDAVDVRYSFDGGKSRSLQGKAIVMQADLKAGKTVRPRLQLGNEGKGTVFPRLVMRGLPPVGGEQPASNGLSLDVEYVTTDGHPLVVDSVEQGTDVVARVRVRNTGTEDYKEVVLSHLVPAGWEIHNDRLTSSGSRAGSAYDYRDVRDDRVYTYFDLKRGESVTYEVLLNASYVGRYYLPMVAAEAMYDATLSARLPGRWIEVALPGQSG